MFDGGNRINVVSCYYNINYIPSHDPGKQGPDCNTKIDKCANSPCVTQGIMFIFSYFQGWQGPDCTCNTKVNKCASSPCTNQSIMFIFSYFQGWQGPDCNTKIDKCASSPCANQGICHNVFSDFLCICQDGYAGKP